MDLSHWIGLYLLDLRMTSLVLLAWNLRNASPGRGSCTGLTEAGKNPLDCYE